MIKHCEKCGKQIHRNSQVLMCPSCWDASSQSPKAECGFCCETNCVAWGSQYFETLDRIIYVDFRADMEFNQIDCQFGTIDKETGLSDEGHWSDFAIDISYCPVCGRKLPPVE